MTILIILFISLVRSSTFEYYDKSIIFDSYKYEYRIYEAQYNDSLFYVDHWTCPCSSNHSLSIANDVDNSIEQLVENNIIEWTIDEETVYYKFYVSEVSIVRIFISSYWGQVNGYISIGSIPTNSNFSFYKYAKARDSIWICPSDVGWSLGWWYIAISRNEPYNNNHFSLMWDTVDNICDKNPIYGEARFFIYSYYSYTIPDRCVNFSVSVKQTGKMFGDIDLYLSTVDAYPNIDSHEYASQNNGDDTISVVNICSDTNTIYVGLYAWQSDYVPFVLTTTINRPLLTRPIMDLPPQQFLYTFAQGQASLSCPGKAACEVPVDTSQSSLECEDQIINCEFYSYFGCLDPYDIWFCCGRFWFLPPHDDVSPWVVVPESAIASGYKKLPRTEFPRMEQNIPGRLTFVQYLYKSSDTDTRRFTPDRVCGIKFHNMIVDSHGRPIDDIKTFTRKRTDCSITADLPAIDTDMRLYEIDLSNKLSSAGVRGCLDKLSEHLSYNTSVVNYTNNYCQLSQNNPSYYEDPCCSLNLTLSEVCLSRNISVNVSTPSIPSRNNTICMNKTIENYILKYKSDAEILSQWKAATKDLNSNFVYYCVNALYGDFDLIGKQCPCLYGNCVLGRCNVTLIDLKQCWWDQIYDTKIVVALFNFWGLSTYSEKLFYSKIDDYMKLLCTGPGSLGFRSHYEYILTLPNCVDDCVRNNVTVLCYTPTCDADAICPFGSATNCYRIFQYKQGNNNQLCENQVYSNAVCLDCKNSITNNGTCQILDRNRTECLQGYYLPGYCSIPGILTKQQCEDYIYCDINPYMYGEWLVDFYGTAFCPEGITNPWGCLDTVPKRNITGCSDIQGCYTGSIFTYHNQKNCPYSWVNMAPYKRGIWHNDVKYDLEWREAGYHSVRKLSNTIDYISFFNDVNSAIGEFISFEYKKKAIARSSALLEVLKTLDCNCYQIEEKSQIDSNWVCSHNPVVLSDIYFNATFNSNSNVCEQATASFVPSNYYKINNIARFSSQTFTESAPNVWSVLYRNSFLVEGQLVSDGVLLEWNFTSTVELCITPSLPEADMFEYYAIISIPYTVVNEGLCVNITEPGTYFAAKLRYTTIDSVIIQSTIASFIYLLLFLVALYQIVNVVMNNEIIRKTMKLTSLLITALFLAMRGVYFILFPIGVISSHPETSYIFFELPTFLFIVINSSIVYLWIEILHTVKNYGFVVGINKKLQPIFFLWIMLLLSCFCAFIVTFYVVSNNSESECTFLTVNTSDATIVSKAYIIFVAGILILHGVVMLLFGAFIYVFRMENKVEENLIMTIQKSWLVMSLSLSFSILKSILTIIAVFGAFTMPILVFTVLEQIPVAILLFYMRPPVKLSLTGSSKS